jgi:hypothetical protein
MNYSEIRSIIENWLLDNYRDPRSVSVRNSLAYADELNNCEANAKTLALRELKCTCENLGIEVKHE